MGYIVRPNDVVRSKSHRYKILKEINKGGFADAFKAVDENGHAVFFKQSAADQFLRALINVLLLIPVIAST